MSILYGIAVIGERDLGTLHKRFISPARRTALVIGKAASAGVRGLVQAAIVYIIAAALSSGPRFDPFAVIGVAVMVVRVSDGLTRGHRRHHTWLPYAAARTATTALASAACGRGSTASPAGR